MPQGLLPALLAGKFGLVCTEMGIGERPGLLCRLAAPRLVASAALTSGRAAWAGGGDTG
jgi:hypothetical protein